MTQSLFRPQNTDTSLVVLVVEDHQLQVDLANILRAQHLHSLTFHSIEAAAKSPQLVPGCIVVDISSLATDGFHIAKTFRGNWPDTGLVILHDHPTVSFIVSAMRSGIDGVVEKPVDSATFVNEITSAMERSRQRRDFVKECIEARQRISRLNPQELQLLKYVVDGVPNKNIAVAMSLSLRTIEKYRHATFETLGVGSAAEAAKLWVLAENANIEP